MRERIDRKKHWEDLYQSKHLHEVGWYQPVPETSLQFVEELNLPKDARIIDIGGGDSYFADHLIDLGYQNITVLDISETALDRAKKRLGDRAARVQWIVADASAFTPAGQYDFWHDRAAFHFLLLEEEIDRYIENAQRCISPNGALVIGTFSEQGPKKCSGLEIRQYSENSLNEKLEGFFNKMKCISVDHSTPQGNIQNFIFCAFKKKVPVH